MLFENLDEVELNQRPYYASEGLEHVAVKSMRDEALNGDSTRLSVQSGCVDVLSDHIRQV